MEHKTSHIVVINLSLYLLLFSHKVDGPRTFFLLWLFSFLAIAAKQIELFEIWELTNCQESNDLQVCDLVFLKSLPQNGC